MSNLTLADIAEVEERAGMPIAALFDPAVAKTKMYQSLVYVIKRKDNPGYTFEEAGTVSMAEANKIIEGDSDPLENN